MSTVRSKGHTESRLFEALQQLLPQQIIAQSDLKYPTTDFVLSIYVDFLSKYGINTDNLCQVPPAMAEKFGDMYMIRRVFLVLREVITKVLRDEVPPFEITDILQPTQGRTAAYFMGICNFMYYSIGKLGEIDDYIDELQAEKKEFDNLLKKREALRQKLNEEAQARAQISDLKTEVANKQHELKSLVEEGNAADQLVVQKEMAVQDLQEKLEQVDKDLLEAQQEMAGIEALVVRSPLAMKNQKCQLEQKLIEVEEKTDSVKEMLTGKRGIREKLIKLAEEVELRITMLNKIIVESKEISNDKTLSEGLRKKLTKLTEDFDERNSEKAKLHERELQLQETESGMLLRYETKKKELQGRIKTLRRDLNETLKNASEEKMSLQSSVDKCCAEISRLVKVYTALCKKYEDMYAALLLKEKSIADEASEELEEVIAKFQKDM